MKKIKNLLFVLLVATICCLSAMLVACSTRSDPSTHTHTYSTQWSYDENYHWHNATCGHTAEINGRAAHIYNGDVCSVCNYEKSGSEDPDNPDNPQKVFKTVSFNLNGGNGSLDNMQFAVGEVMATLPSPTRDGYTFICWEIPYIGEEYTSASVMPNRDLQLSARWEKNITGYSDEYVSFKPSSEGVKDSLIREMYRGEVDKFVYVEITSDDLGGIDNVGKQNNFNLRTLEGMQYSVKSGYTWAWYQGNFDTPNGAQRFTLCYGSNIQFITISDNSGVVQQTYLLDIYVKHDYYISLYSNIFEQEPYDKVRVIENERFSADTKVKESKKFEFDSRVYFNTEKGSYEKFVYSTAITKNWNLYQTYKDVTIPAELDAGILDQDLIITPYTQYFTLPSPEKDGYDFLGWQDENGDYLTNIQGYSGVNYISEENNPSKLTAVFAEKKYYYTFENDILKTYKTVPVVTYTDKTMRMILDIEYTPYNTDCVLPIKTVQSKGEIFVGWQHYYLSDKNEFSKNLSSYDFDTKIVAPLALAPEMESTSDYVIPLNAELTSREMGNYRMYLPANERYKLTISTTSSVTLTINQYGATSNSKTLTIRSGSPQTINLDYYVYNLGSTVYSHGYVTFKVTSLSGSFTAKLVGSTAETSGTPIVTNEENTANVGDDFTVPLVKPGYAFDGWYEGDTKISENEFITTQDREMVITAKWVVCPVTLEKSIAEAGTVSGVSGTTAIGKEVTITATTNNGYTFVGWYEGEKELSKELSYTFAMPSENTTYTAKWVKLTLSSNNTSAGSVSALNNKYTAGQSVTITATTNNGYTFVGWYEGEKELSKELSYTFAMPSENTTYTAKWVKLAIATDNSSAGTITRLNGNYLVGQSIIITATENLGYTFVGWYEGEKELSKELSYNFAMPSENTTYTAKWEVSDEMSNYAFSSTDSTCTISGIKDKTVTDIIVPDYVTNISSGAFEGCSDLVNITLPFVGTRAGQIGDSTASSQLSGYFGAIFGYREVYNGSTPPEDATCQLANYSKNNVSGIFSCYYFIPKTLRRVTITKGSIRHRAFTNCSMLTAIILENEVTEIEYGAFTNCSMLENVTLSNKITSIGSSAFYGCTSLQEITIPNSVTSINSSAFNECNSLKNIFVDENNTAYTSESGILYNKAKTQFIHIPKAVMGEVIIPVGITTISNSAFSECDKITAITIPDNVTAIGQSAFYNCTALTKIYFNAINCDDFSSSSNVFYNAGANSEGVIVYFGKNVAQIPNYLFYSSSNAYSPKIVGVEFEDNSVCTTIGNYAFYYCGTLTEVILPNSITTIGNHAFYYCGALMHVTISNGVTSIGSSAFYNCKALTEIHFNAINCNDFSSSSNVFYNAGKNENGIKVVFGKDATKIPAYLFYMSENNKSYSPKIKSVEFEENSVCTAIGNFAFYYCTSLTEIQVPTGIKTIGNSAFYYCEALDNIVISDEVQSIGDSAFYLCSEISEIEIPARVTTIGNQTFYGCSKLIIYCEVASVPTGWNSNWNPSNRPVIWDYKNNEADSNGCIYTIVDGIKYSLKDGAATIVRQPKTLSGKIVIPQSVTYKNVDYNVTTIGKSAFYDCSALTSVSIPGSITTIENYAFYNCTALTEIFFNAENCNDLSSASSGNYAFANAGKESSGIKVVFGKDVTKIPAYLFRPYSYSSDYVPNITSMEFEENSICTEIGAYAFYNGSYLTSIVIPNNITKIGNSAFYRCSVLTEIYFYAKSCSDLSSNNNVFYQAGKNGNGIKVIVGKEVRRIPGFLFSPYDGYSSAEYFSPKIISVEFEENSVCSTIGTFAFEDCRELASITIPKTITSIDRSAFGYCYGLLNITFGGTKAEWQAITKGQYWNTNTGNYMIHCTNGNISK